MSEKESKKNVKLMRAFIAYREDLITASYNPTEGDESQWFNGMSAETELRYFERFLSLIAYNDENIVITKSKQQHKNE